MVISVLSNVILLLLYMIVGYGAGQSEKKFVQYAKKLSKTLIYFLCPCMIINSFVQMEYSRSSLADIFTFFGVSLAVQISFFILLYLIFHKKYNDAKYRVMSAASVLGNVGFLGLPIVVGLFPDQPIVACYSSIFVVSMNLLVFTLGVFMITNDKKYISVKSALLNPTTIAFVIALPLFLCNVIFPTWFSNLLSLTAKFVTPVCMIVLGIRLSTMNLKNVFKSKIAYFTAFLKLIVFPFFALLIVKFIPVFSNTFKFSLFVLCAMPSGAIISSLAEIHECEREEAANVVLLSTILSMITIPLLVLIIS